MYILSNIIHNIHNLSFNKLLRYVFFQCMLATKTISTKDPPPGTRNVHMAYKIFIGSLAGFVVFLGNSFTITFHLSAVSACIFAILHRSLLTCFPTKALFPQPLMN